MKITIVDSLTKRITFLNYLTQVLKLNNVTAVSARAEDYAIGHRETFDIVTARAVARLNILAEFCLPLWWSFYNLKRFKSKRRIK